ncbi:DUF2243 domain-containing protein [Bacillus sp. SA1-12]|uniref:DUF2243 domain-containing protein n=1 Tax=Bacillus sp. SA1-12 TaxID=1455638 RepID=UPI000696A0B3|nr:DUF2243 domain-containing protein [Bacillus sp. SA1-12]
MGLFTANYYNGKHDDGDRGLGKIENDGFLHFAVTIALVLGNIFLWVAGNSTSLSKGIRLLVEGIFIGGGHFNLVKGIVNHHILQIIKCSQEFQTL